MVSNVKITGSNVAINPSGASVLRTYSSESCHKSSLLSVPVEFKKCIYLYANSLSIASLIVSLNRVFLPAMYKNLLSDFKLHGMMKYDKDTIKQKEAVSNDKTQRSVNATLILDHSDTEKVYH